MSDQPESLVHSGLDGRGRKLFRYFGVVAFFSLIIAGPVSWLKGQLHAHTANSRDSEEPIPAMLARYEEKGFDFVVVTDHNVITQPEPGQPILSYPGVELFADVTTDEIGWQDDFSDGTPEGLTDYLMGTAKSAGDLVMVNHPNRYGVGTGDLLYRQWELGAALVEISNMPRPWP